MTKPECCGNNLPLQRGCYTRRWARRLHEHGFTREDAVVLSLGTFGTNLVGDMLGVDTVIMLDMPLINHFYTQHTTITRRLQAMTQQLQVPYREAKLPSLQTVAQALGE